MTEKISVKEMKNMIERQVSRYQGIAATDATKKQIFDAVCFVVRDICRKNAWTSNTRSAQSIKNKYST